MISLFICPYDPFPCLIGFGEDRWVVRLETQGSEYETFFESISQALHSHQRAWSDVEDIFLVCGPAGFSATRVTTLMLSTLRYVYPHIAFYSLDRFMLAHALGAPYPLQIEANRAEYLIAHGPKNYVLVSKEGRDRVGYDMISDPEDYITYERLMSLCGGQDSSVLASISERVAYFRPMYLKKAHITLPVSHTHSL